uniref:Uncharacterized protein n=1 Tax=Heterorhabditis bacteriophora TaxID=37862 RepID=A0A1I7WAH7_HETBA
MEVSSKFQYRKGTDMIEPIIDPNHSYFKVMRTKNVAIFLFKMYTFPLKLLLIP